ncbi:MAG: cysteine desulfurase CsdA, partial [Pseudoxanthomonas sp.]
MNAPYSKPATIPTTDWEAVRADFPLLTRQVQGKPLIYLDSANTGQKP